MSTDQTEKFHHGYMSEPKFMSPEITAFLAVANNSVTTTLSYGQASWASNHARAL